MRNYVMYFFLAMSAQKAHAGGKPCMDYFDYVCKASDIKLLDDRKKEMKLLSNSKRTSQRVFSMRMSETKVIYLHSTH